MRRDTAARWQQFNPILLEGELGFVTDNLKQFKIGDGVHNWKELPLIDFSNNSDLLLRLQGTSAESSAETDPFISLGVFTGEDVWGKVRTTLNGLVITEETETHRWAGLCRLSVDGARVEVVNFPLDYAAQSQVQVMTGCVASADGETLARGDWQQLVRSHTSSGGWTRWQAAVQGRTDFAGVNAIADAEDYASAANAACDVRSWAVTAPHGGREVVVGRLWQLSDAMGHQLTQVLLTHHEPGEDGSFGAHTDGKLHMWKRSYGLLQGSSDCAPIGKWTAWTDLLNQTTELEKDVDDLMKNGRNWYRYGAVRAPQLFALTTSATSDEVKAALTDIAGNHPRQEGLDACISGHLCLVEYVMGGTVMVGWSGHGYVLTYVGQLSPTPDVYACTITVSATDADGETTYAVVRDGTRIKVTAYGNVTEEQDGIVTADMYSRMLNNQVVNMGDVPNEEGLIEKIKILCDLNTPRIVVYERGKGDGATFYQGWLMLFNNVNGLKKHVVCFEASGNDTSYKNFCVYNFNHKGTDAWEYVNKFELGGDSSELESRVETLENDVEDAATLISNAQITADNSTPAGFDAIIENGALVHQSTIDPDRIVFIKSMGKFGAQKGLQYYFSWTYTSNDNIHKKTAAYNIAGKTYLNATTNDLYVLTDKNALEKLAKASEVESSVSNINDSIEEINSNVIPALNSQIYETIGVNSCTTKTLINETKSGTSANFSLGAIKTGEIIPQNGWMTIVACVTTSANEPGMSVQADYGEEGYDYLIDQDRLNAGTRAITRITKEHTMMPSALDGGENVEIKLSAQSSSNFTLHWAILYESDPYGNPRRRGGSERERMCACYGVQIQDTFDNNVNIKTPVVYNERTGWFEMNGLTDISWKDMRAIANSGSSDTVSAQVKNTSVYYEGVRTNSFTHGFSSQSSLNNSSFNDMEVLHLNNSIALPQSGWMSSDCSLIAIIGYFILGYANAPFDQYDAFGVQTTLESVKLRSLKQSFTLNIKMLSWDSINYLITNAANTDAITITVHADVYGKMTGGTVDDWGSLGTLAEEKGVKLVAYGESGYPFLTRVLWHGYKRLENKINAAKSGDVIYIHPDDRRKITAAQRDDWAALVTAGAEKQISFALPAES